MLPSDFAHVFSEQQEKLEAHFLSLLRKVPGLTDKAVLVEDLIQLTAFETLEYCLSPKSDNYPLVKLIWLKAENVWKTFIRPLKRKILTKPLEDRSALSSSEPTPLEILENK